MASSDGPTSQTSGSRFAGTRSRQAGRRGRAALRSLRHLPPSVVLLTGLLAGFAVFQLLRAAQQAESADALADWAGACARLEEAYGTDAAMRIEALRIRTVGKSSGPFAAGEIPHPPVPGPAREEQPSGSAPASALPGDLFRSQAFAARPSSSSRAAPAILRFLSDASPEVPSSRGNHRRPRKQELSRSGRICSRQAACLPYRPLPSPKVTGKTRKARPPRS